MSSQEALVSISAGQEGRDEVIPFEADCIHGGKSDAISIESPVLLAREVDRVLGTESFQLRGEELRLAGRAYPVAIHKILGRKEVADGWNDSRKQDADGALALPPELCKGVEAERNIPFIDGITEIKDTPCAC